MSLTAISSEFVVGVAILAVLVGIPLVVVTVIALLTGYIQYDAEQRFGDLESDEFDGTASAGASESPDATDEPGIVGETGGTNENGDR